MSCQHIGGIENHRDRLDHQAGDRREKDAKSHIKELERGDTDSQENQAGIDRVNGVTEAKGTECFKEKVAHCVKCF